MDKRLECIAGLVRSGSRLADIGTDHAYLPVALVGSGTCPSALACDVREGPLQNARQTVEAAGLSDRIECRLGDGLSIVQPDEADDIVIAGMGGETIAAILAACPWTREPGRRFLLQPMTHAEDLRRHLFENGFAIRRELTVAVGRHVYLVMAAEAVGAPPRTDAVEAWAGRVGAENPTPTDLVYLTRVRRRLQNRLRAETDAHALRRALSVIDERLGKEPRKPCN
ncbi:MAG: SAM-dependent methyltransferase [Clostridia bacterium]|nr:SAM-dependent methyltransferase [Clostridia bacterium]